MSGSVSLRSCLAPPFVFASSLTSCSCAPSLVLRARLLSSAELRPQSVQARLPQFAVAAGPVVELPEGLRPERVEPSPAIRTDTDESGVLEDGELPRYTGLSDVYDFDELGDRALTGSERLDEAAAGGVAQDLEDIGHGRHITHAIYVLSTMCRGVSTAHSYWPRDQRRDRRQIRRRART